MIQFWQFAGFICLYSNKVSISPGVDVYRNSEGQTVQSSKKTPKKTKTKLCKKQKQNKQTKKKKQTQTQILDVKFMTVQLGID